MLIEHRVRLGDRQRGAALLVSLIFLVVLTLLGLQAMRGNVTQERMAGNMRERNLAFQAAEAALRVGEATRPFVQNANLLTDPSEWLGDNPSGTFLNFDPSLANDPAYHVGPLQRVEIGLALPKKYLHLWPVTAVGYGGQDTSVVVLQSWVNPDDQ